MNLPIYNDDLLHGKTTLGSTDFRTELLPQTMFRPEFPTKNEILPRCIYVAIVKNPSGGR